MEHNPQEPPTPSPTPKSVFISHSSRDKPIADKIVTSLEQNNISCWIAPRDIAGGTNYGAAITKGIRECAVLLLLYSANSNASQAVYREVQKAFEERKHIVPLRIESVPESDDLSFFLSGVQWVNADPHQENFDELAAIITALPPAAGISDDQLAQLKKRQKTETLKPAKPKPEKPPIYHDNRPVVIVQKSSVGGVVLTVVLCIVLLVVVAGATLLLTGIELSDAIDALRNLFSGNE